MSANCNPPRFCPDCGERTIDFVMCKNNIGDLVYDSYCKTCEWSGDILPDKDSHHARQNRKIIV